MKTLDKVDPMLAELLVCLSCDARGEHLEFLGLNAENKEEAMFRCRAVNDGKVCNRISGYTTADVTDRVVFALKNTLVSDEFFSEWWKWARGKEQ